MPPIRHLVIIGGGPCGLGAAYRAEELIQQGQSNFDWNLVDASSSTGGLAASLTDDCGFIWDKGGHVIFSHYTYFSRLLDLLIEEKQWNRLEREAWVWMRKRFIPYPFQQNLHRLPIEEQVKCIEGLLHNERHRSDFTKPQHFRDWLLQSFGSGLCDTFMIPYNFKVWAYRADEMNVEWMGERVATVDTAKVIRNVLLKQDELGWGPNSTFRFPLYGGTGAIWNNLASNLPQNKLHCNKRVIRVNVDEHCVYFADGSEMKYDQLISTMPLDQLLLCIEGADIDKIAMKEKAAQFKYSSSHIIGIGLQGQPPEHLRTKCWMYFPESDCPFYRATVFSNYSPYVCPKPGKQWSLMCEVSESCEKAVNVDTIIEETIQGLLNTQLISKSDVIVSRFHTRLDYGYPTPFYGRDVLLNPLHSLLERYNIFSRGRFGCWKYEVSNQDHSLMQGVEVVDRIMFGTVEMTFQYPSVVNGKRDNEDRVPYAWRQRQKQKQKQNQNHQQQLSD